MSTDEICEQLGKLIRTLPTIEQREIVVIARLRLRELSASPPHSVPEKDDGR